MAVVTFLCILIACVSTVVGFQSGAHLLHPQPGVSLQGHSQSHPVHLEVFLDLNCENSKRTWMTMKELSAVYEGRLEVVIQQFPQPYHTHAFILTQGYFLVHREAPDSLLNYTDLVFEHLESFNNEKTFNLTTRNVIRKLSSLQFEATGINPTVFEKKILEHQVSTIRIWQYAAAKGVAGTPWFYLNGYNLNMNPNEHLGIEDWKLKLGRLLGDIPVKDPEYTYAGDDLKNVPSSQSVALTQSSFVLSLFAFLVLFQLM